MPRIHHKNNKHHYHQQNKDDYNNDINYEIYEEPFECVVCDGFLSADRPPSLNLNNCSCAERGATMNDPHITDIDSGIDLPMELQASFHHLRLLDTSNNDNNHGPSPMTPQMEPTQHNPYTTSESGTSLTSSVKIQEGPESRDPNQRFERLAPDVGPSDFRQHSQQRQRVVDASTTCYENGYESGNAYGYNTFDDSFAPGVIAGGMAYSSHLPTSSTIRSHSYSLQRYLTSGVSAPPPTMLPTHDPDHDALIDCFAVHKGDNVDEDYHYGSRAWDRDQDRGFIEDHFFSSSGAGAPSGSRADRMREQQQHHQPMVQGSASSSSSTTKRRGKNRRKSSTTGMDNSSSSLTMTMTSWGSASGSGSGSGSGTSSGGGGLFDPYRGMGDWASTSAAGLEYGDSIEVDGDF